MDANKNTSLSKIEGVKSNDSLNKTTDRGFINFLKTVNPLGTVAEAYAKTLAYKLEVKRLEIEEKRIKEQANIIREGIDKTFQLKMEELTQRRINLIGFYNTLNKELDMLHIERKMVLEMIKKSHEACLQPNMSIEDRTFHKDMVIEMTKSLPEFGNQANIKLQTLVQALPKVEITNRLIES